MSDETQTEQVEGAAAPAAVPAKKKTAKDPLGTVSMLVGALGIIAILATIAVSFM